MPSNTPWNFSWPTDWYDIANNGSNSSGIGSLALNMGNNFSPSLLKNSAWGVPTLQSPVPATANAQFPNTSISSKYDPSGFLPNDSKPSQNLVTGMQTPGATDPGKWSAQDYGNLINGMNALGNLGLGAWSLVNASRMFNFQKDLANQNLVNQAKSYNTALEDKIKGRYSPETYQANKDKIDKQIADRQMSSAKL